MCKFYFSVGDFTKIRPRFLCITPYGGLEQLNVKHFAVTRAPENKNRRFPFFFEKTEAAIMLLS